MADPHPADPVLLIVAAFSRHPEALVWARERLEKRFGPVGLASEPFDFTQTEYYARTMGVGLRKLLFAFRDLIAPDRLAEIKLITNGFERELAAAGSWPEPRPLNLDPGILTLGKFHLATTKDQGHRVYLRDGIFAEVTLRFHAGTFEPWPWTYADYRLPAVIAFLNDVRDWYRRQLDEIH
jgi:hypothetical protein